MSKKSKPWNRFVKKTNTSHATIKRKEANELNTVFAKGLPIFSKTEVCFELEVISLFICPEFWLSAFFCGKKVAFGRGWEKTGSNFK